MSVPLRANRPSENIEKTEKLLKQMLNDGTYWIAADEMTGGWSHDQFANRVKKKEKTVIALLCSFINLLE